MKNRLFIALVAITLVACNRTLTPQEKLLCGKWMTTDRPHNNHEKFIFRPDGTFADTEYARSIIGNALVGDKWKIADNKLTVKYKRQVMIINVPWRSVFNIITLTDSVLVIERPAHRQFKGLRLTYRKMKG